MFGIKTPFSPYWRAFLPIYWVICTHLLGFISLLVRVWGHVFNFAGKVDLLMKICAGLQRRSFLRLQSIESDLIQYQSYNRSKDPLVEGCIKQRCERGYSSLSDLIYNDRGFAGLEFRLIQIVLYLVILISIVDVV